MEEHIYKPRVARHVMIIMALKLSLNKVKSMILNNWTSIYINWQQLPVK